MYLKSIFERFREKLKDLKIEYIAVYRIYRLIIFI